MDPFQAPRAPRGPTISRGAPAKPAKVARDPTRSEPASPSAFACSGSWENARCCMPIDQVDDPLDGCSQSVECRRYTLEQNPPTTRFSVKPRRDGRFEIQQFRDFIREHNSYHMKIEPGRITVTFPGKRTVPKSKRFFLHVKNVEEAELDVDKDFELIMTMERMVLRQAGALPGGEGRVARHVDEDPEARRRRIAEKLRKKASVDARSRDFDDDELDIDIDLDVEEDIEEPRRRSSAKTTSRASKTTCPRTSRRSTRSIRTPLAQGSSSTISRGSRATRGRRSSRPTKKKAHPKPRRSTPRRPSARRRARRKRPPRSPRRARRPRRSSLPPRSPRRRRPKSRPRRKSPTRASRARSTPRPRKRRPGTKTPRKRSKRK